MIFLKCAANIDSAVKRAGVGSFANQSDPLNSSGANQGVDDAINAQRCHQYQRAIDLCDGLLEGRSFSSRNNSDKASVLRIKGSCQNGLGSHSSALKTFTELKELNRPQRDLRVEAGATEGEAHAYFGLGRYKEAFGSFSMLLHISKDLHDKPGEARAHGGQGKSLLKLGNFKRAISYLSEQKRIVDGLGDELEKERANGDLEGAYLAAGKYGDALKMFSSQESIANRCQDELLQAIACGNLARLCRERGQYDQANEYHRKAYQKSQELRIQPLLTSSVIDWGWTYFEIGAFKEAASRFDEGLKRPEDEDHQVSRFSALLGAGYAHLRLKSLERSASNFEKALEIANKLGNKPMLTRAETGLGCAQYEIDKNDEQAVRLIKKGIETATEIGDLPALVNAYGILADVKLDQGRDKEARVYHDKESGVGEKILKGMPAQPRMKASLRRVYFQTNSNLASNTSHRQFFRKLFDLAEPLSNNDFRYLISNFMDQYTSYLHRYVAAAMTQRSDDSKALKLEEMLRCLTFVAALAGTNAKSFGACRDLATGSKSSLCNLAKSLGAAFLIVYKVHNGVPIGWVICGKRGKVIYSERLEKPDSTTTAGIEELISSASFVEWGKWERRLQSAQRLYKDKENQGERDPERIWIENPIGKLIPDSLKSDLDEELWKKVHDPKAFTEMLAEEDNQERPMYWELKRHFIRKEEVARLELSKQLWDPLVRNCPDLRAELENKSHPKLPVSRLILVSSRSRLNHDQ